MSGNTMYSHEIDSDLVICGGGGAGLSAALTAAENGMKKITLLEKRDRLGGNTASSFNFFAINSPSQKRAGINTSSNDFFRSSMSWSHWKTNPKIVRAFIEKSGDTIEWLEEKGLIFECNPLYIDQELVVSHRTKGNGAEIIRILRENCKNHEVDFFFNTQAKKIKIGSNGNINGLTAESDKEEFIFNTKAVIISTGGYGGNKELMKRFFLDYEESTECGGIPNTGDGLLMSMEIGAATEGLGQMLGGGGLPGPLPSVALKVGRPPDTIDIPLVVLASEPNMIWVNNKGERFADETLGSNHPLASQAVKRQPNHDAYTIFDQGVVKNLTENGLIAGYLNGTRKGSPLIRLAEGLEKMAQEGWVKISDDWGEIEKWIGADHNALYSTIEEYNVACDAGLDPVFSKSRDYMQSLCNPPFYAIRSRPMGDKRDFFLDTYGGIKINERMEVIDKNNNPIKGLFAAGVVTGGWEAVWDDSMLSGNGASFAFNSGRIAAENAIRFNQYKRRRE